MTGEQTPRFAWLPWRREPRQSPPASAQTASPRQRHGWLGWLGKPRSSVADGAVTADALLDLARAWVLAQGGRLRASEGDVVAGTLPEGTPVRYTRSAARARREPDTALLAPGTPAFEALLADVTRRGTALFLHVPAARVPADALARQAFASPAPACPACATSDPDVTHHAALPACPITAGRFVVLGHSKGVRDADIERQWDALTAEHTFRMAVTSAHGRHEEIVRIAMDAATGERRQPFDASTLRRAAAAPEDATQPTVQELIRQTYAWAEAQLEPAALAAARLARLRALAEYQRRQEHITATFSRLLMETPNLGQDLLAARERELAHLAEVYTIELEAQHLNAAVIASPMAHVRVRFAGGGAATLDVDLAHGTVAAPRCMACGSEWRLGARCAEGHITCQACQQVCAHCGVRRCAQCAAAPMEACSACGALTCASCARATARGRHRLRPSSAGVAAAARPGPEHTGSLEPAAPTRDSWALTVSDLDAMTPATWRTAVFWLLEGLGYTVERTLADDEPALALVCRSTTTAAADAREVHVPPPGPHGTVLVLAHRAMQESMGRTDPLARVQALAAQAHVARALVLTTVPLAAQAEQQPRGIPVAIVDRAGVANLLASQAAAHVRARAAADSEADDRARAAAGVRETLMAGLNAAAAVLAGATGGGRARHEVESATMVDHEPVPTRMERITARALVVRRALAAIETLVAEWEACFAPTPTREGTLAIMADVATLEAQRQRADHLADVLRQGCADLAATHSPSDRTMAGWVESVLDELRLHCRSLVDRCAALDPSAWRSFERVRDDEAIQASAEALAASNRSGMRARRLQDEIAAHASAAGA